jgi:hypothetical protein
MAVNRKAGRKNRAGALEHIEAACGALRAAFFLGVVLSVQMTGQDLVRYDSLGCIVRCACPPRPPLPPFRLPTLPTDWLGECRPRLDQVSDSEANETR